MGLLLMQFRKMSLLQERNNIQYQLLDLNQQLNDLQSLSATLANDSVTLADVASMPASLFGTGLAHLSMSDASARQYADTVIANMDNASVFTQFQNNAQQMREIAYMKAYEQGREQYKKLLQKQYNQQEKQIQLKKTNLETRDKCLEEELNGISEKLPEQVSASISHYGLKA